MLVTALNPYIGYKNSSTVAKYALKNNLTLRQAVVKLGLLSKKQYDMYVNPQNMLHPEDFYKKH